MSACRRCMSLHFLVAGFALLSCGEDEMSAEPTLPPCAETEPPGTTSLALVPSTLVGTVEPLADRLDEPGELNPATEEGEIFYEALGLAAYHCGPALPHVQRTSLGGGTDFGERHSLAYFVQLSDIHLVDDESALRWGNLDNTVKPGSLRPQEAYLARALSALNRTLARLERPDREYDFGIITGDIADSAQYNEVRWFIDIMDGVAGVHMDSGDDNDPIPGPDNDPKDAFDPVAFPAPWLCVFGNHDLLVLGFVKPAGYEDLAVGDYAPIGTRDYTQWFAPIIADVVPADPDRRIIDRDGIVAALQDTDSVPGPIGHGFASDADTSLGANYEYDVVPDLLRVIQLDSNDDTGGSSGLVRRATVEGFLRPALERAASDGVLVIVASHHSPNSMDRLEGESGEVVAEAVDPVELEQLVASYPNAVVWLVGHSHTNYVRPVPGADVEHPGYWEIMAAALTDWPSQARITEIVANSNDTLSIFSTVIDFVTGEQVPDMGAESNRQALERILVNTLGYEKKDVAVDVDIEMSISGEPYRSQIDLVVSVDSVRFMAVKCAAGSLGSREREILAAARLLDTYQIPLSIVSDGKTAIVLDTITGKKIGEGLHIIPAKAQAREIIQSASLQPLALERIEREKLIFRSYDSMNVNVRRNLSVQ